MRVKKQSDHNTVEGILTDYRAPEWAFWYARNMIEGRWSEAEDIIKTSPECAFRYALNVIKSRWPEAEDVIRTEPEWILLMQFDQEDND